MTKPTRIIDITGFPLWRRMLTTAWECLVHPLTPTELIHDEHKNTRRIKWIIQKRATVNLIVDGWRIEIWEGGNLAIYDRSELTDAIDVAMEDCP